MPGEEAAKKSLLAGQVTYEDVVLEGGKQYLRMATAVPVVMVKCVMCHSNLKGNKGVIGSLSYKVPLGPGISHPFHVFGNDAFLPGSLGIPTDRCEVEKHMGH